MYPPIISHSDENQEEEDENYVRLFPPGCPVSKIQHTIYIYRCIYTILNVF